MDNTVQIAVVAALSALVGALIPSLLAYRGAEKARQAESTRHLREIILKTALEEYRIEREIVLPKMLQMPGPVKLYPLDDYILGKMQLVKIIERDLSPEELIRALERMAEMDIVSKQFWDKSRAERLAKPPEMKELRDGD